MSALFIVALAGAWLPGRSMPTPGFGFATAVIGTRIYAIGGTGQRMEPRMVVEAYDVEADTWITGFAQPPRPVAFAGCAALEGKIYIIGGSDGRTQSRRVDRLDPAANQWDTVAPLPWVVEALGACTLGRHIYAVGGYSNQEAGSYIRRVARFIPDSGVGRWEIIDSLTTPRANVGVAAVGNRVYAVGGQYFNSLASAEFLHGGRWVLERLPMHQARSGLAAVGYDQFVVAAGGGTGPQNAYSSVELLNTQTSIWIEVDSMSVGRIYHGAGVVGDWIVVLGGRMMHGGMGSVERHLTWPGWVAERPEPVRAGPRLPTVSTGPVRIELAEPGWFEVYDRTGSLVVGRTAASGRPQVSAGSPSQVSLPAGVYFVRGMSGAEPFAVRLTVVR